MNLIIIHKSKIPSFNEDGDIRHRALSDAAFANIIFEELSKSYNFCNNDKAMIAIPDEWYAVFLPCYQQIISYGKNIPLPQNTAGSVKRGNRIILSSGRYITSINCELINRVLANRDPVLQKLSKSKLGFDADVTAINAEPTLLSYREKVRITSQGNVAGFRRLYYDSAMPVHIPTEWPHHIFINPEVVDTILVDGTLPLSFADFVDRCASNSLKFRNLAIGGSVLDLGTEAGLHHLITNNLNSTILKHSGDMQEQNCDISRSARFFGKISIGKNVSIDKDVVIVGPVIIADHVKIAAGATIRASVIASNLSIPKGYFLQNRILLEQIPKNQTKFRNSCEDTLKAFRDRPTNNFRIWPRFSYVRCIKRITDIIVSLIVLILFMPVLPVIAIVVKLNSAGPIFFKAKREGLHGKEFFCLKFRTMMVDADKIQEKLRFKNLVDGPQFKMKKDPRITTVGKFLRDTFIDEIPQFINVLLGQMSVVGPRPSPREENVACPSWRDARLSVRPGITGLWQICRTRRHGYDFQEWIHYDTKYVMELSFRLDLLVYWRTAMQLITTFVDQF